MATFTVERSNITFETTTCIRCGAPYALSKATMDHHRKRGGFHYCPFCKCSQGWDGESKEAEHAREIANLKAATYDAREEARRARQDAEHFERSRNAYKGRVTQLKNRAAAGLCPCCNRHFTNLERHMATKHPAFTKEEE